MQGQLALQSQKECGEMKTRLAETTTAAAALEEQVNGVHRRFDARQRREFWRAMQTWAVQH